jgi:hypothetical protein
MKRVCIDYKKHPIYIDDELSPKDTVIFILVVITIFIVEIIGIYLFVALLDGNN